MGKTRRWVQVLALACAGTLALPLAAQADWPTYHQDAARDGADHTTGPFTGLASKWTSQDLGGKIWAEPLIYKGLVIAVTEQNDVYALNEQTGQIAWHVNAGAPVPSSKLPCPGDLGLVDGITSTPVIDPSTGTLYVVADLWNGSAASHVLAAYNASTGKQLWTKNVDPPDALPLDILQRNSLNLAGGHVVFGYGGNDGDCGSYKGSLASVSENGSSASYWKVPTSKGGAIWAPSGPTVDSAGAIYSTTGNSNSGSSSDPFDYSEAVVKFPSASLLSPTDYFAPDNWYDLNATDADIASASPVLLPNSLIYQEGKDGNGYLLSAGHLGHIGGQLYKAGVCGNSIGGNIYYAGIIYVTCAGGPLKALRLNVSAPSFSQLWSGPSGSNGSPIIAAGLVWVISWTDGILYGLSPSTGAVLSQVTLPDTSNLPHFLTPAASNGELVLADGSTIDAFAIGNAVAPPATRARTTLRLTASPSAPRVRHAVKLVATASSSTAPTGIVEFESDRKAIKGCAARALRAERATCTTRYKSAGLHDITVRYGGDAQHLASSAGTWLPVGAANGKVHIFGLSLRGLHRGAPRLAFTLRGLTAVREAVVILPPGLRFRADAAAATVTERGKRLKHSAVLQDGALVIYLKNPRKRFRVTISGGITVDSSLLTKLTLNDVKRLTLTCDVAGLKHEVARLVSKLRA